MRRAPTPGLLALVLSVLASCGTEPDPCRAGDIGGAHEQYPPDAFVRVPAGTHRIGPRPESRYGQSSLRNGASYSGNATFTYDLLVAATEVTNAEWDAIFDENPTPPTDPDCPDCPVHMVVPLEAMAYCNERSRREGLTPCYALDACLEVVDREIQYRNLGVCGDVELVDGCDGYRLPDVFEYDRFARAGGDRDYWCGDIFTNSGSCVLYKEWAPTVPYGPESTDVVYEAYGVTIVNRGFLADLDRPVLPQPVASSCPNSWGIYDPHGNVAEILWPVVDLPLFEDFGEVTDAASRTVTYDSELYFVFRSPGLGGRGFHDARSAPAYQPQGWNPSLTEDRIGTGFRVVRAVPAQ